MRRSLLPKLGISVAFLPPTSGDDDGDENILALLLFDLLVSDFDLSETVTNLLMNPLLGATVSLTGGVAGGTKLDRIKIKTAIKYGKMMGMAIRKPSSDFFLRSCLTMVASLKLTRRDGVFEPRPPSEDDEDSRLLLRRLMIPFGGCDAVEDLFCCDGGDSSLSGL